MCEAVTSTCGCGQERSVGDLLRKAMKGLLVSASTTCYCFPESTVRGAPDHWLHRQHQAVAFHTFWLKSVLCHGFGRSQQTQVESCVAQIILQPQLYCTASQLPGLLL